MKNLIVITLLCVSLSTHAVDMFTPTTDFIDNADGTVRHRVTGLTWMRCSVGETWSGGSCTGTASYYNFEEARMLTSNFANHSDWRLPTPWELVTIVDYDILEPAVNHALFPSTPGTYYWSGLPYAGATIAVCVTWPCGTGWKVDFFSGVTSTSPKSETNRVRLVRNGRTLGTSTTPSSDFTQNGDGTITDSKTNLTWMRCPLGQTWGNNDGDYCSGTPTTYTQSQAAAITATYAGISDWRLPNVQELQSIVEYASSPAINYSLFPSVPNTKFWSSTSYAGNSNEYGWNVDFNTGDVATSLKSNLYHVRLVRQPTTPTSGTPKLVNISTRGQVMTGNNVMIAGFIISGGAKRVIIRALGPSLASAGVSGALADPKITLYSGQTALSSNDDWRNSTDQETIQQMGLAPQNAKESAILVTLNAGAYTVVVEGVNGLSGIGLVSVDDLDELSSASRLINISTRAFSATGGDSQVIAGFVINGGRKTVLMRGFGPSLNAAGISNALSDPAITLYSGQSPLFSNDNWGSASNVNDIQIRTNGVMPATESAIYTELAEGAYTVIMRGVNNSGTGLIAVEE